ncbi:MAG: outer membrane protein assembly factor BamD [Flavobacteriaceae bacterium]|nr:outer membrane protein assembly factor BamD [Flavobacteriaceae bacterium]
MQKIKSFSVVLLVFVLLMTSCSEYQKVLNKGTATDQYKLATELYEKGKYNKAIALFEKIIPSYQRKPQMERIQYMVAEANFKVKNYDLAAYYFNRFVGNYPSSSRIEEAAYLVAMSYYLNSPKSSLDQSETEKAMSAFQSFIDKYPNSEKAVEANKYYDELVKRLEKKSFDIAKQYYQTENYKAAVVAFDTFLEDNFGTSYKEDAMGYKFMAAYQLGMKSVFVKKEERLNDAIAMYKRFEKEFPQSDKLKQFASLYDNLNKELISTEELQAKIDNNGL